MKFNLYLLMFNPFALITWLKIVMKLAAVRGINHRRLLLTEPRTVIIVCKRH